MSLIVTEILVDLIVVEIPVNPIVTETQETTTTIVTEDELNGENATDVTMIPRIDVETTQEKVRDPNLRVIENDAIDFAIEAAPQSVETIIKLAQHSFPHR